MLRELITISFASLARRHAARARCKLRTEASRAFQTAHLHRAVSLRIVNDSMPTLSITPPPLRVVGESS
jgi:hypothetical protein